MLGDETVGSLAGSYKHVRLKYIPKYCKYMVAQLVEALRYKFDSRWCHLNFSLT